MAALLRVVTHRAGEPQWITLCSGLIQTTLAQQQWGMLLHCSFQKHYSGQLQLAKIYCDLLQTIRRVKSPQRTFHCTKVCTVRGSPQPSEEKVGTFTKIIEAMGFTGPLKYKKWKIKIAALRMYTCCVEKTDYEEFFNRFQMPDTLNSWFLITQLHVWMCLVRMKQEGRAGKYMCHYIVYSMWEDVEQRGKVMGGHTQNFRDQVAQGHRFYISVVLSGRYGKYFSSHILPEYLVDSSIALANFDLYTNPTKDENRPYIQIDSTSLKASLKSMTELFYAALFGYDEGILSNDHVLAAALWRNLFEKHCEDPRQLAIMVEYVRKQVQHLDAMSGEDLLLSGEITWRPLVETNPQSIVKPAFPVYNDEGL